MTFFLSLGYFPSLPVTFVRDIITVSGTFSTLSVTFFLSIGHYHPRPATDLPAPRMSCPNLADRCSLSASTHKAYNVVSGRLLFLRHSVKHYEAVILKGFITSKILYAAKILIFCIRLAVPQQIEHAHLHSAYAIFESNSQQSRAETGIIFRKAKKTFPKKADIL